jgi:regulation of enolase protein 1 (concanavalin A-like superfamily)
MAADGFGQVLRGEWTKLVSVRSTVWCLFLTAALTILLSLLGAQGSSTNAGSDPGPFYDDRFQFMHQQVAGDGTITARVVSQEDTGPWARAGIMIKESIEPNTPYAAMMVTPDHGVRFQANFTTDTAGSDKGTPLWLRLTRSGTSITGYESVDGNAWHQVGTIDLPALSMSAQMGMFSTSPSTDVYIVERAGQTTVTDAFEPSTATFDSVTLTSARAMPPEAWQSDSVGGPVQYPDGKEIRGEASGSGGTFTVTGFGDIREIPASEQGDDDIVRNGLGGVYLGMIAAIVLGVLFVTTEFKTGVIRTTFTASPRRGRVLLAKAIVLGTLTFAGGLVATVVTIYAVRPIQRDHGFVPPAYPDPSLTDWPVLRAVLGTAAFLAVIALFALGVGAILRRAAGALVLVIALAVVPGIATGFLPMEAEKWVQRLTPLAGLAMQQTRDRWDNWVNPWAGFAVTCGYAVVALGVAFWLIRKRDTA